MVSSVSSRPGSLPAGARAMRAQRPAASMPNSAMRRRRRPAMAGLRRSEGTSSARRPAKLSELITPRATSSASASSACEGRRPVPALISSKKEAPWVARYSAARCAPPERFTGSGVPVRLDHRRTLRRARSTIGVVRTGAAPRSGSARRGARRVHTKRPARHCSSSHAGSYSLMRCGRISVSQALAGAS